MSLEAAPYVLWFVPLLLHPQPTTVVLSHFDFYFWQDCNKSLHNLSELQVDMDEKIAIIKGQIAMNIDPTLTMDALVSDFNAGTADINRLSDF